MQHKLNQDEDDKMHASVVVMETSSQEEEGQGEDEDFQRILEEALERQDRIIRTISDRELSIPSVENSQVIHLFRCNVHLGLQRSGNHRWKSVEHNI